MRKLILGALGQALAVLTFAKRAWAGTVDLGLDYANQLMGLGPVDPHRTLTDFFRATLTWPLLILAIFIYAPFFYLKIRKRSAKSMRPLLILGAIAFVFGVGMFALGAYAPTDFAQAWVESLEESNPFLILIVTALFYVAAGYLVAKQVLAARKKKPAPPPAAAPAAGAAPAKPAEAPKPPEAQPPKA